MRFVPKRVHTILMSSIVGMLLAAMLLPMAHAGSLRNKLIKRPPQLYMPSQVLPGRVAKFTITGQAGQTVRVILSPNPQGAELANGIALRVGMPTTEQSAVIPETGVVEVAVPIPAEVAELADKLFAEAVLWSAPDQSDAVTAQIIDNSGAASDNNALAVGVEPDPGSTMLLPGDQNMSGLLRSVTQMNDIQSDPRKRSLIDDGSINRKRQIDQTLGLP